MKVMGMGQPASRLNSLSLNVYSSTMLLGISL